MKHINSLRRQRSGGYRMALLATIGSLLVGPAWSTDWSRTMPRLDDLALGEQRGGFRLGNMEIEIGLEQVVAIDGQIEIINRLMIPNLNSPLSEGPVKPHMERVEIARIVTAPSVGGTSTSKPAISTAEHVAQAVVSATELRNGAWVTRIQNDMNERVIQNIRSLNIKLENVGRAGRLSERFGDQFLQSPSR